MNKKFIAALIVAAIALVTLSGCGNTKADVPASSDNIQMQTQNLPFSQYLTLTGTYPHSTSSFTQGLFFHNGQMYESVGGYSESAIYKNIFIDTGEHEKEYRFADDIFAEGSVVFNKKLYVLTWQENLVMTFSPDTLEAQDSFNYPREGWGLTTDGEHLIASDGTSHIYFMDSDLNDTKEITVTKNGKEINNINELEYIDGYIWANVWLSNEIIIIDKNSGEVVKTIDFSGLYTDESGDADNVLNGIAYNHETKKLYITGKRWDTLYEFEIK